MFKTFEDLKKHKCLIDNTIFDETIFLHGVCGIFAIALHDIKGFDIVELYDEDKEVIHYFCQNNNKYYDIRGEMSDLKMFLNEFADFFDINKKKFPLVKINDYDKLQTEIINECGDEFYKDAYTIAKTII